jgi:hypothetical protein
MPHTLSQTEKLPDLSPNEERRSAPRYRVTLAVSCQPADNAGPNWSGQVRDVSAFGVGFLLARRMELSTLLEIELAREGRGTLQTLLARVVHVEADKAGYWLIGCAFTAELTDMELQLFQAQRVRPAGQDGRRWVRFPCNVETVCYTCQTVPGERRPARVVNVSPGGIGLLLPCEFPSGTLLHFQLPANVDQPAREVLVRVVRAMEHASRYWFHGCEFAYRLDEDELRALLR